MADDWVSQLRVDAIHLRFNQQTGKQMEPSFKKISAKKLVGKRISTSLTNNKTGELWKSFMPARKNIGNNTGTVLYSLQVYPPSYFLAFNPAAVFEKWAAIEVSSFEQVPVGMEGFELAEGLYAVFVHKGSCTDASTFQYIFSQWLPHADHVLDDRPHFELLGEKYKNGDPSSEEEIWIPVKAK